MGDIALKKSSRATLKYTFPWYIPESKTHATFCILLVQKSIICEDVIMYFKYTITILKVYLAYTFFTQQQYTFSTLCCVLKVYLFSMRLARLLYTCNVKYSNFFSFYRKISYLVYLKFYAQVISYESSHLKL